MDIIELGIAFRAARIERRLTQAEVAQRAGVSVATVARLERGELLELGVVKLLSLFTQVGLELYPRPVGHRRTLDDIQRERANDSASALGLRAAINASNASVHSNLNAGGLRAAVKASLEAQQGATDRARRGLGLRAAQSDQIAQYLVQRVRHSKKGKPNG